MKFPRIKDVSTELRRINRYDSAVEPGIPYDDQGTDVRLCIEEDGSWNVLWGDSSYDQRHSPMCGASSVPGDGRRFNSRDVAKDLIDQCRGMCDVPHVHATRLLINPEQAIETGNPDVIVASDALQSNHPEAYKLLVGLPATLGIGSDRYAGKITDASSGLKQITFHGGGHEKVFSLRKDGTYRPVGSGKRSGCHLHIGSTDSYHDPSF